MRDYFSIARDKEVIEQGGFWCGACCVGKEAREQSLDERYCQNCYELLLKEAELLPSKSRRSEWIPQIQKEDKKVARVSLYPTQIKSTLKSKKSEVDTIKPTTPKRPVTKRGRKQKALPIQQVKQWASQGLGSKAIATRLRKSGVVVSYKTVQRVLSGQR